MEGSLSSVFNRALLVLLLHVLMTCIVHQGYTYGVEGKIASHTVPVSSLLPSPNCSTSTTKYSNRKSILKVVHRHGPCSPLVRDHNPLNVTEILLRDQSRVKWIRSQSSNSSYGLKASVAASLPAKPDITDGEYVVTIGLGTPKKDLTLLFDTGSSITWTQCKPCMGSCYNQSDPIFNPSQSSSYANISCSSTFCALAGSGCFGSTCKYSITYGDNSSSVGFFATEKLTISPTEVIDNFKFGCDENISGNFGTAAGLIGLSDKNISFVEQTAAKYGKYFSYCMPSSASSTGHLTFGKDGRALSSVRFTPLSKIQQHSEFYGITILGISVNGVPLSIPSTVSSSAGAIIDSGTTITQLPPTVYSALRTAFRKAMVNYTTAPAVSTFDTCYDFSKESTVTVPSIKFSFAGGVDIDLDRSGILYMVTASQFCLAFAANSADSDVVVYGNAQQRTFEVAYDVAGRKLGFAPNGCS
ncbi:hypothetical protein BT93_L1572 [Corymbia citriodora subsp. variegata]|uniref:Peptidase A1 domain-containing protein n=1 Tax=Corymbia citriodora subsp. variegata TaxID=360336 RepID=A0A8T0CMC5_CORYI|nr:hypothetical protein BT93_L1572 [Corymbia citriodora subsp. variegata]